MMLNISDKNKFWLVNGLTIIISIAWIVFLYNGLGNFMSLQKSMDSIRVIMNGFFFSALLDFTIPVIVVSGLYSLYRMYKKYGYDYLKVIVFEHFKEVLVCTVIAFLPILINKSYLVVFFPISTALLLPVWVYMGLLKLV